MKTNELVDYLTAIQRKPFWKYNLSYYLTRIKSFFFEYIIHRPFCVFGYHKKFNGIHHTHLVKNILGGEINNVYEDGYKCYHCHYCDEPIDQELHNKCIM